MKWEYKIAVRDRFHMSETEWLNIEGGVGWELVSVMHAEDYTRYYLKRQKGS